MDSSAEPLAACRDEETPAVSAPPPSPGRSRTRFWTSVVTGLVLVVLAVVAVRLVMTEVDFKEVWGYLDSLPLWKVTEAVALTVLGYLVLTLYDVSALHYLRVKVPYWTTALASFAGYAISNNVGWAMISGASVRFRIYSAAGLRNSTIAKVVVFSATTFTLGICFMGSLALLIGPHPVAVLLSLPEWIVQAVAGGVLAGLVGLCLFTAVTHRPVRLWKWTFQLPSGGIVLAQIVIASAEIVIAGACLWLLLPADHGASLFEFLGIFCAALALGMLSHVPGGLGVFETIMLLGLSSQGSAGGVLGALLAYRFVYYVLPLGVAGVMLFIWEVRAKHGPVAAIRAWLRRGRQSP